MLRIPTIPYYRLDIGVKIIIFSDRTFDMTIAMNIDRVRANFLSTGIADVLGAKNSGAA